MPTDADPPRRMPVVPTLALFGLLALSGCGAVLTQTTADVSGIAGAGLANAVTKDAAVATGIGLGIRSVASIGLGYVERRVHAAEQDRIAEAAGPLPPGGVATWRVVHRVPIEGDEHGEVSVVRDIGGDAFACKEIVFSIDAVRDRRPLRSFYTATVCRDGAVWRWASAEPATERWGALQ
jgi:uncharacterized protein YceK